MWLVFNAISVQLEIIILGLILFQKKLPKNKTKIINIKKLILSLYFFNMSFDSSGT